jgi:hypothetical protein
MSDLLDVGNLESYEKKTFIFYYFGIVNDNKEPNQYIHIQNALSPY